MHMLIEHLENQYTTSQTLIIYFAVGSAIVTFCKEFPVENANTK